jgi:hypothetical protein
VRFVGATLALLTLAALLAACGSYTKHDFTAAADAICASTVRETRTIAPPSFAGSESQRLSALSVYVAQVLPIVRSEVTKLRALRRPNANTRDHAALLSYLDAVAQSVEDYRALGAAARRGDPQGVTSAEAALGAGRVASLAASYGLRSCGAPGATVA